MKTRKLIVGNTDLKTRKLIVGNTDLKKIENTELMIMFGTGFVRILSLIEMCQDKCGLAGIMWQDEFIDLGLESWWKWR